MPALYKHGDDIFYYYSAKSPDYDGKNIIEYRKLNFLEDEDAKNKFSTLLYDNKFHELDEVSYKQIKRFARPIYYYFLLKKPPQIGSDNFPALVKQGDDIYLYDLYDFKVHKKIFENKLNFESDSEDAKYIKGLTYDGKKKAFNEKMYKLIEKYNPYTPEQIIVFLKTLISTEEANSLDCLKIKQLIDSMKVSKEQIELAMFYLFRLDSEKKRHKISENIYELLGLSIRMAQKYLLDYPCNNKEMAQALGLGVSKYNGLEFLFLTNLQFNLNTIQTLSVFLDFIEFFRFIVNCKKVDSDILSKYKELQKQYLENSSVQVDSSCSSSLNQQKDSLLLALIHEVVEESLMPPKDSALESQLQRLLNSEI